MNVKRTLRRALVAAALAGVASSSQATAQPAGRSVYLLRDSVMTGFAAGSTQGAVHGTLKTKAGAAVGTLDVAITATVVPQAQDDPLTAILAATATLPGGQISVQGVAQLGDHQQPFVLGIVGGTGDYRGAHGVLRVRPSQTTDDAVLVFDLAP